MRRNNGQRVCLLAFAVFASHFGMQPLDRESAQQKTAISSNQANQKAEPSNPQQSSQLAIDKKATNNQTLTNHQAWYWRKAFAPEYLSNWALVGVGIGGIVAAILTLSSIKKQSRTLVRQTAALVEGQRPSVSVCCHGDATKTFGDRIARRMELKLENKGQHRARDLVYETWIEILPLPFKDFTESATHFKCTDPISLYPGHSNFIFNIPIQREVKDEEWAAIRTLKVYVCVRIQVSYRDAFGQTIADFGYYVTPTGMGFLPKYNNTTQNDDPNWRSS